MNKDKNTQPEKVYIIRPVFGKEDEDDSEIAALVESAGASVLKIKRQTIREINPATFIGAGKLEEIREELAETDANLIVFDGELSPSQTLNIRDFLGIKTIDRTTLILDIFALSAKSAEGKLQVELAQLKYIYPRLRGKGAGLSQQGGGIGTRGPGETQLETDRRHIRRRIDFLENALSDMEKRRSLQSARRKKNNVKSVALVGYTNTGKSTLLNALTGAGVLAENRLFATLDPTLRRLRVSCGEIVLADTVGFVKNIPHSLIEAFKSTLETAVDADLVLIVCDARGDWETQLKTTEETLREIGAKSPKLVVFNKCDGLSDFSAYPKDAAFISALRGIGLESLMKKIDAFFADFYVKIEENVSFAVYGALMKSGEFRPLIRAEFTDDGVKISASVPKESYFKFKRLLGQTG